VAYQPALSEPRRRRLRGMRLTTCVMRSVAARWLPTLVDVRFHREIARGNITASTPRDRDESLHVRAARNATSVSEAMVAESAAPPERLKRPTRD